MPNLSIKEKLVLELLTKGESNKKIAKILNISVHTVKVYMTSLLKKFNAQNRTELAFIVGRNKIIQ
ncbi:response regulator transcription factor [bacterium]|nr:response regulator transcription factor [bacterium]